MEGRDADPSIAAEYIELELMRNKRPDRGRRNIPMSEEEISPNLDHDPGPLRHGPWPMILFSERVHARGGFRLDAGVPKSRI
jgi:hypothetical protein